MPKVSSSSSASTPTSGSQVFSLAPFTRAVEVLAEFFAPLGLPELVVGGGLGVAYVNGEEAPPMAQWASSVSQACRKAGIPDSVRVTAEPGRSIVASAAITLYRVGTVKDVPGHRTYVSVDGGMSDNPRPVLYGSGYEAFLPRVVGAARPWSGPGGGQALRDRRRRRVRGVCSPRIWPSVTSWPPRSPARTGTRWPPTTTRCPRPAVVFVADGEARVVVRRETFDDLIRLDL